MQFRAMDMIDKIVMLADLKGWDQGEFESLVPLPKGRISKWKSGTGEPTASQALQMARLLNVTVEFLIDPKQDQPVAPEIMSLSEDERAVIDLYHALQLDRREAMRRLASPSPQPNVVYRPTGAEEFPPEGVYIPPGSPLHAPETPQKKRRG